MTKIEAMIRQTSAWRKHFYGDRHWFESCACAVRLHALLDAYKAVGGDDRPWRKESGLLR